MSATNHTKRSDSDPEEIGTWTGDGDDDDSPELSLPATWREWAKPLAAAAQKDSNDGN